MYGKPGLKNKPHFFRALVPLLLGGFSFLAAQPLRAQTYIGNQSAIDSSFLINVKSTLVPQASFRFTLPGTGTHPVTAVNINYASASGGSSGNYTLSIQTDSGGSPSGVILTSTTVTLPNSGGTAVFTWATGSLPVTNLTSGTVYHLVVDGSAISNNKYISLTSGYTPFNQIFPLGQLLDPNCNSVTYDGVSTWTPQNQMPNFVLQFNDPSLPAWGDPYDDADPFNFADSVDATGEVFTPPNGTVFVNSIGVWVHTLTTPADNLYGTLVDLAGPTTLGSVTILESSVNTYDAWVDATLASPISLSGTDSFELIMTSPNSTAVTNSYAFDTSETSIDGSPFTDLTYGGSGSYEIYSFNNPTPLWTPVPFEDMAFRLAVFNTPSPTNTPPSTSTVTPTYTPTSTNTATATGTATNTATPTATNSATSTATFTNTSTLTPTNTLTSTPSSTPTGTATSTSTFTPTNSMTATPTGTNSFTPTATNSPTATPTNTPTLTPINTATSTYSYTATSSVTPTGTNSFTNTPTATSTGTGTATFTPTSTGTPTASFTNTPTLTPVNTATSTATATYSYTPTFTSTNTLTGTATPSATASRTPTASSTSTGTPSSTPTGTATLTATVTSTSTPSNSPTSSFTPTASLTPANTLTATPSSTPTGTATSTSTSTSSLTPTSTFTPSVTFTPTNSPTPTSSFTTTPTPTITNTPTITDTPTISPTFTPTGSLTATPTPQLALYLDENYFDPENQSLGMDLRVDTAGQVKVMVFNMAGEEVVKLRDEYDNPGNYRVFWTGLNTGGTLVGNAVYYVVVEQPSGSMVRKVIVLK